MHEDIQAQLRDMIVRSGDALPGAIIMSPTRMKRFLNEPLVRFTRTSEGSGWAFEGVPIYRSWEIIGPAVVSKFVLRTLFAQSALCKSALKDYEPLLF